MTTLRFSEWRPHPWHGLSAGRSPPFFVNAYIEITPFDVIKYEVDKVSGYLRVDRPQRGASHSPALYGFIPQTYCGENVRSLCPDAARGDGDPLDICVISERPIDHSEIIVPARVVGGLQLLDRGEADDKIIAVLENDLISGSAQDIGELPLILVERLRHYFSTYKLISGQEPPIIIQATYGRDQAARVIEAAMADYAALRGKAASAAGGTPSGPFTNDVLNIPNRFTRISFSVTGVDVAVNSQGGNLDQEMVNIAVAQALSMWSAVTPLTFEPASASEETRMRIEFLLGPPSLANLGSTSGFISRTPAGIVGSATVRVNCGNDLVVDSFQSTDLHSTLDGPFDLVSILAHEIGHGLGLDHPPVDPGTGSEIEGGIMSASVGGTVRRQLLPYDVREVRLRYGAVRLGGRATANLAGTAQLIDASPGVVLQKGSFGLIVFGPGGARALLDVLVPAKGKRLNALRLKLTLVTWNLYVNRVLTFDGIAPLQDFAVSARAEGNEGLKGRFWDMQLGFLRRPTLANDMIVRLELIFTDHAVLQLEDVSVETLPVPLQNAPVAGSEPT